VLLIHETAVWRGVQKIILSQSINISNRNKVMKFQKNRIKNDRATSPQSTVGVKNDPTGHSRVKHDKQPKKNE